MLWGSSPAAIANRFNTLAQNWVADGPAARAERARRKLMAQIAAKEPATLNEIASAVWSKTFRVLRWLRQRVWRCSRIALRQQRFAQG